MPKPTIHVIIKDKNGVIADEAVTALSSYNDVGLFDVLPMHTNFISLIKGKIILHKIEKDREIKVGTGLLQVISGEVHIYLGLPETTDGENKPAADISKPLEIMDNKTQPSQGFAS